MNNWDSFSLFCFLLLGGFYKNKLQFLQPHTNRETLQTGQLVGSKAFVGMLDGLQVGLKQTSPIFPEK